MWWVVPEGFLGKLVNALSNRGVTFNLWTVKQSSTKPTGAVAGPFSTQAQALQVAAKFNANPSNVPTLPNVASQSATSALGGLNDLASRLEESQTWVRVGEAVVGGLLIYVGAKSLFPQYVNTVTTAAKRVGKSGKAFL